MSLHWRIATGLAAGLALILGLSTLHLRCQLADQRAAGRECSARVAQLTREQGAADVELAVYQAALAEQSTRVAALAAEGVALRERAAEAESQTREVRVIYRERVREVMVAPVPTQCEEAVRWGADRAREAAQLWRARSPP